MLSIKRKILLTACALLLNAPVLFAKEMPVYLTVHNATSATLSCDGGGRLERGTLKPPVMLANGDVQVIVLMDMDAYWAEGEFYCHLIAPDQLGSDLTFRYNIHYDPLSLMYTTINSEGTAISSNKLYKVKVNKAITSLVDIAIDYTVR
ncbi:MAG: hypothetical protein ACX932_03140 [Gammaproteobacteria bacterium]